MSREKFLMVFAGIISALSLSGLFPKKARAAKTSGFNGRKYKGIKGVYDLVLAEGEDPFAITVKAIKKIGGMELFVKKGATVLVKPNILPPILLLSASFWYLRGSKIFAFSTLIAGVFGLALMLVACWRFDSWTIWLDWYEYLHGVTQKLSYPSIVGNFSTTRMVTEAIGGNINIVLVATALLLAMHGLWAAFRTKPPKLR